MAESESPGPGKSTADAAVNELKKQIAQRNEAAHKAWRKKRTEREQAKLADMRKWQQL
jgi:broad-specificity NMP kinase